ncbi:MAG: CRISPR-associated protein Cas4 [Chloroflexi bacterium]|nr:CRISPR-associated protein Cas4 [Chloroflexota bacterium]
MLDDDQTLFRVTDLKEYIYCARVLFYEACLPDLHPSTYKMQAGVNAHEHERERAARRTLKAYGLPAGTRHFDVAVRSHALGLSGEIDEVVVIDEPGGEVIVVDYKLARKAAYHFKLQLAAYALMLAETWQVEVARGFMYLIPTRQTEEIVITTKLRRAVANAVNDMRQIVETETMPAPTRSRKRCMACKHRRFCNDV